MRRRFVQGKRQQLHLLPVSIALLLEDDHLLRFL